MGKCISKNPTSLTIALSEKDLARASHILSKFTESSEYIALKDEHRNQLCEYFAANNTCGGQALAPPPNAEVVVIQTTSISHRTQEPSSSYRDECGPGCRCGDKEQEKEQRHWQPTNEENTCLQSLDRETAANYRELKELEHCWPKIASHNCSNKGNDAFENNDDDDATIITAPSPQRRNDNDNGNGNEKDVIVSAVDGDRYTGEAGIVESANSCHSNCSRNKYFTSNTINNDNNNHLANNNNNPDDNNNNNSSNSDNRGTSDNNNYYADVPQYLAQLILYHQSKQRPDITIHSSGTSTTTAASVAAEAGDHLQRREAKKTSKSKKAKLKKSKGCNSFDYVLADEGNADAVVVSWSFRINLCCALWSN